MAGGKKRGRPAALPAMPKEAFAYLKKIRENGVHAVCFFNNKGGVGKTTLVANLAAQLALGAECRVLVVDADPQCNLTQYLLQDEDFLDAYNNVDIESIYSIIHPISIGKGYQSKLPIRFVPRFNYDVIIGDPRLALKEDLLAQDWRDAKSGGTRGLRTTFMFTDLIKKSEDYDFIFFDMGPSLGAINRSILLAVDSFVVPMSIDIFSLWAIRNIGSALKIWQKELDVGMQLAEDPKEVAFYKKRNLNLVGYVTQQHKERVEDGNVRVVEAYEVIRKKLPGEVHDNLGSFFSIADGVPHLGDIKHLGSLAPKSQTIHTPMTMVALSGSYTSLRKRAREIYSGIGMAFLKNIAARRA